MNNDIVISPIFYMGNKKKIISKGLVELFPKNINTFYDLFAGSAIVSMNVKAKKYVVNDINQYLCWLYNMFKTCTSDEIIQHIEWNIHKYGLARERTKRNEYKDKAKIEEYKKAYMNLRNDYNNSNPRSVFDFYTLMFYSFSQQFRFNNKGRFNMPCGNDCFSEKNKEYIVNGCKFFAQDSVFTNWASYNNGVSFKCIRQDLEDNDFIYLDPPYRNTTAVYNENSGWNEEDELSLYGFCEMLNSKNIKWAMSNVFENKHIENIMLKEWCDKNKWNVYGFDKFSYTACGKGNANTKEVLITNY